MLRLRPASISRFGPIPRTSARNRAPTPSSSICSTKAISFASLVARRLEPSTWLTSLISCPHPASTRLWKDGSIERFSSNCHPMRSPRRLVKRHRKLLGLGQAQLRARRRVRAHHPLRLPPQDRRTKSCAFRNQSRSGRTLWLATLSSSLRREFQCFHRWKDSTRANGKRAARIATNGITVHCARKARHMLRVPQLILRKPHPYGGAFKDALMQWAKSGCQ